MRSQLPAFPFRLPLALCLAFCLALAPLSAQSDAAPPAPVPAPVPVPAPTDAPADAPADARTGQADKAAAEPQAEEVRGLRLNTDEAVDGYTLIAPLNSHAVLLVDMGGEVVHRWDTEHRPGAALYMLENGNLLHCGHKEGVPRFHGGGIGGVIQEIDWDGKVVWEYELASDKSILHHDIAPMPNGHVLAIAWEARTPAEAIARGRDEEHALKEGFWPDVVHEIRPTRPSGGEIVWTWSAWDHLVQDRDPKQPGYGKLSEHPGRIDINADHRYVEPETDAERLAREEAERQMAELGYTGGAEPDDADAHGTGADDAPAGPKESGDFLHTNSVDYLPESDLIVLSTPHLCELWVIDHSTTTAEAAGSTGGRRGKGGELLWRWGNPRNYGLGDKTDQTLFYQHNPTWLTGDVESEGLSLLVFNNGGKRPGGDDHSSVEELRLPFDPARGFLREAGAPFGPAAPAWVYADPGNFFSAFISGSQRLAGGNTLICSGAPGRVFEITPDGRVVWDYLNPHGGEIEPSPQGGRAPPKALFRATRIARDHPGLDGRF
jgi:hypothetical protein